MKIFIVGAGVMGLAAALDLLEDGHDVTVLEAGPEPGGMAGSFDFGDIRAEKYYHFICGADRVYFRWLERLGLEGHLRWRRTHMAVYRSGRLFSFGDPLSLLRFRPLSLTSRARYGLHVLSAKQSKDWKSLESRTAREWLLGGAGEEAYRVVWEPLLRLKFGEDADFVSAAWIWSRIHRLASSRNLLFQEKLGFLDGGTDVLIEALTAAIAARRGTVSCGTPVERIHVRNRRVVGLRAGGADHEADAVVSTVALPILVRMTPDLPGDYVRAALGLRNIGVRCIVLKLRRPFTRYFWINVNDDDVPLCGLVEYTNLNPAEGFRGHALLYSPLYVDRSRADYARSPEEVLSETVEGLSRIRPDFDPASVIDYRVFREPYAQPVCPVGFTRLLAPLRTPVSNLVAADTTHLLPHDRSISDSLALAARLTAALRDATEDRG